MTRKGVTWNGDKDFPTCYEGVSEAASQQRKDQQAIVHHLCVTLRAMWAAQRWTQTVHRVKEVNITRKWQHAGLLPHHQLIVINTVSLPWCVKLIVVKPDINILVDGFDNIGPWVITWKHRMIFFISTSLLQLYILHTKMIKTFICDSAVDQLLKFKATLNKIYSCSLYQYM